MADDFTNVEPVTTDDPQEPAEQEVSPAETDETPEWQTSFDSPEDMYKEVQELKSLKGKQGNEIGEMRQMLQDFVSRDESQGTQTEEPQRYYDPETQKAFDLIDSKFNISEKDKAIGELREQLMFIQDKQNFNDFKNRHSDISDAQSTLLWKLGAKVDGLADYEQLKKEVLDPAFESAKREAGTTVEAKKRAKGTPSKRATSSGGSSLLQEFANLDRSTESGMARSREIMRDPGYEVEKKALRTQ